VKHREQIDAQHAFRAVNDHLRLHRPRVPGQLELAEAASAPHDRAPLVECEVRIAAERAPLGLDVLDLTEELLHEIHAVHAEIAKWVARVAIPRRQRPAFEWRILRAAENVDGDDVAERAGLDGIERALDLRIVEQRMVDADGEALRRRDLADLLRVGFVLGDRFLDEHVTAALERGDRDLRVHRRRRQHVDHVRAGGDERVEIGEGLRAPFLGVRLRARGVEIGDADELDPRQLLDRRDVKFADVAGADHAGAKRSSCHRCFLVATSSTVFATSPTRAVHVSACIALDRFARASGLSSASA